MAGERDSAEEPLDEGAEVEGAREEPRDPDEDEGEAQDSPAEGDARPEGLEHRAISAARGAASATATTLKGGLAAMRDVREASRQHAGAQKRVRSLTEALDEDRRTLAHRQEVEGRYEEIVSQQTDASRQASQDMADAQATVERLDGEQTALEDRLSKMRAAHEQELRPYRRVMETSRGRASDASQTVAEAKRAVKGAEAQVKDATNARSQGIAQANRALDNSQERLRRVQDDLRRAQADPGAKADAVAQLQRENVAELAHVEAARAEVANATRQTQEAVEKAQMHLWTQRQSLETAQADAKAAHDEAADAYDEAQGLLSEAEAIHATPEETRRLAASIAEQQAALASAQSELDSLADSERTLRQHTRTQRYILTAVAILLVALIVLIAMTALGH